MEKVAACQTLAAYGKIVEIGVNVVERILEEYRC